VLCHRTTVGSALPRMGGLLARPYYRGLPRMIFSTWSRVRLADLGLRRLAGGDGDDDEQTTHPKTTHPKISNSTPKLTISGVMTFPLPL
jgi:hypothetical protein